MRLFMFSPFRPEIGRNWTSADRGEREGKRESKKVAVGR